MPDELQARVHEVVQQTQERSGWGVRRVLAALGVPRSTFYRWLRGKPAEVATKPPPAPYEALASEREATRRYALRHAELRHRELAWRMVDEDVAYLSPSTVYRILRTENLVCPWRRRTKRSRGEDEKAARSNQIWATDLKYVQVGGRHYYLICFLDEYSRYIVHHELLRSMDSNAISTAAQAALEKLPRDAGGQLLERPEIRSDNGSGYISREFGGVLDEHGLTHRRIRPHCPEENGVMERANRTLGEALEDVTFDDYHGAVDHTTQVVRWYNEQRLHSALGYLRPVDYYHGQPDELHEARRVKMAAARHRRKEHNLGMRQQSLPLHAVGAVA